MKMSKYFSDANEVNNFNGSEFLNADGGSSAGMGGSTSQPYILSIANSTTDDVATVVVGGAYRLQTTVTLQLLLSLWVYQVLHMEKCFINL